jgi:hypothetical protein
MRPTLSRVPPSPFLRPTVWMDHTAASRLTLYVDVIYHSPALPLFVGVARARNWADYGYVGYLLVRTLSLLRYLGPSKIQNSWSKRRSRHREGRQFSKYLAVKIVTISFLSPTQNCQLSSKSYQAPIGCKLANYALDRFPSTYLISAEFFGLYSVVARRPSQYVRLSVQKRLVSN